MFGTGKTKIPVLICPGCNEPMKAAARKPVAFSNGLVDVTYVCETCHAHHHSHDQTGRQRVAVTGRPADLESIHARMPLPLFDGRSTSGTEAEGGRSPDY
jgi:hypothetical protein